MTEDKKKIIEHKIQKALSTYEDAIFLIENNKYHIAVNRLYYSVFYIISALAIKNDFQTNKHAVVTWLV